MYRIVLSKNLFAILFLILEIKLDLFYSDLKSLDFLKLICTIVLIK